MFEEVFYTCTYRGGRLTCCQSHTLQEADRLKCASSVVHQADQACRRLISEAMKTARGEQRATIMSHSSHLTHFVAHTAAVLMIFFYLQKIKRLLNT